MRAIVTAGLVVAVMALAGCTDEPEPRFEEPTETPSASDPTSSAAAEPEPWEEKSKAGAVAFAGIGLSLQRVLDATGDTAALEALSTVGACTCDSVHSAIEGVV